jgi:hypothetical protein
MPRFALPLLKLWLNWWYYKGILMGGNRDIMVYDGKQV